MKRALFLDRDGVINRALVRDRRPYPPASLDELEILPGVVEAAASLKAAGYCLIVVTNQPDVGKGIQSRAAVEEMHKYLRGLLPLDAIKVCYHTDADGCSCRKPRPGMLQEAAREWDLDLTGSYLVGDRWRDIGAAKAAGCISFLVQGDYDEPQAQAPDFIVGSLLEASRLILRGGNCG
jgi:D-glycero-D-manno-heptose 1,7-bisphosphate phosphatase